MKILVGVSFAIMLVLGAAGSCAVDHPSDALACTTTSQCTDGRTCVDGYCVVGGGSGSGSCPSQCSSCDTAAKTCAITNVGGDKVTCPSGFNCTITCSGNNCRNVDCTNAASCTIACSGQQSCESINCGFNRCTVTCSGQESCASVNCQSSCACDVTCTGSGSCGNGGRCPLTCDTGLGCSSQPIGCDICL